MVNSSDEIFIGAHTSTAGGLENALLEGARIGASTIQFFTSNQRQWKGREITPEIIDAWQDTLQQTGIKQVMSHDSYLINLGSPDPEGLAKSRQAFHDEIKRCVALGVSFLNFHPGAATDGNVDGCLDRIVESLIQMCPLLENSTLQILLETTAGQGTSVGHRFEQLHYIIDRVKPFVPIGICIDTCHIFVAGYDVRTRATCDLVLKEFNEKIGLSYLKAFHLNDSVKGFGSRVDRHASLGMGQIGWECFEFLMQDPRTRLLPKYLETPEGPPVWEKEIKQLRNFACV